jgi:Domain of unknown function (DUF4126)
VFDAETLVSICLGLGLSAACGFRIFVPFLMMNLAARAGFLVVTGSFEWIGSTPALVMFAVATVLEIGAYFVPWLDHLLDTIATPAAAIAGIVASASVITGMDPLLKWPLAVIAGGGVAGAIQVATVGARGISTLATGGLGNPVLSTAEAGTAAGLTVLALVLPVVAVVAVIVFLFGLRRLLRSRPASG